MKDEEYDANKKFGGTTDEETLKNAMEYLEKVKKEIVDRNK